MSGKISKNPVVSHFKMNLTAVNFKKNKCMHMRAFARARERFRGSLLMNPEARCEARPCLDLPGRLFALDFEVKLLRLLKFALVLASWLGHAALQSEEFLFSTALGLSCAWACFALS
jgi:hypothetical protein